MIRSMTGFGRASFELSGTIFEVEVRSVNHRYLDLRVKLPRVLAGLEPAVREGVQGRFARGKVEVGVSAPGAGASAGQVQIDFDAAGCYVEAACELERRHGVAAALDASTLLALPGVSRVSEVEFDAALAGPALLSGVEEALAATIRMRDAEGEGLDREFRDRLARIVELVDQLDARSGSVQENVRERLRKRARELESETGLLDEARLHQEIVLAADRYDIAEELSRLRSHVGQFLATLDEAGSGAPVGRRLDFLLQELGRESNTIGSKVNDADMAHLVVELKTEHERIREQVQNVE
jgi:uncharacterized protein (TIGR00255 family)